MHLSPIALLSSEERGSRKTGFGQHIIKFKKRFSKNKGELRKMVFDRSIDVLSRPSKDGIEDFFGDGIEEKFYSYL